MSQKPWPRKTCSPVSPHGKDERPTRWRRDTRTGTESFCNGWRIAASLLYATRDSIHRKNSPFYGPERLLSTGKQQLSLSGREQLNYGGRSQRNRTMSTLNPQTLRCVRAKTPMHRAPSAVSPSTWRNQPQRAASWRRHQSLPCPAAKKESGSVVRELKNQIGLRRLRLRRIKFVREHSSWQRGQNIKRLVRFSANRQTRCARYA